jgi:pantothenate kinase
MGEDALQMKPMTLAVSFDEFAAIVASRGTRQRSLTAIAGPPGAGKSLLADRLAARLNAGAPGTAAVLPMDGYHYDDLILVPRGLRARKGAPDTFDVGGLRQMLIRLRANDEAEIMVPVFDRDLEIARAGARAIPRTVRHVIVEGNYLLLDREPWQELRPLFATTAMLAVPEAVLRQRLIARWQSQGLSGAEVNAKVEGNDLPNGRLIVEESAAAEFSLTTTA